MECPRCFKLFDSNVYLPRLLTYCGHTLCSNCIRVLLQNNNLDCPQCGNPTIVLKETDLPPNLVVLSLQNNDKRRLRSPQQSTPNSSRPESFSHRSSVTNQTILSKAETCKAHGKRLEAFCLDCFDYGCLECVINHAKGHELKTIQQAIGFFKEQAKKIIKFYREMKLSYKSQRLEIEKNEIVNLTNAYKTRVNTLFSDLRSVLEAHQTEALDALKTVFESENTRLSNEEKELQNLLNSYNRLIEMTHSNSIGDCVLQFQANKELFDLNRQKYQYQNYFRKDNSKTGEDRLKDLNNWEQTFSKIRDKLVRQIKAALDVKSPLPAQTREMKILGSHNVDAVKSKPKIVLPTPKTKVDIMKKSKESQNLVGQKKKSVINISFKESIHLTVKPLTDRQEQSSNTSRALESAKNLASPRQKKNDTFHRPILIYGGYTEEEESSGIEIYGHDPEPTALERFQGSTGHVKFGVATIKGAVFVLGGKINNRRTDLIIKMDSTLQTFQKISEMSRPKSGFGCCRRSSSIYVIGGNDSNILNECEQYYIEEDRSGKILVTSNPMPRLQVPRDELTAVLHKCEIYAIGGYNLENELSLKIVEKYNQENRKWEKMGSLVIQRRSHASISLDSGLYVVGGYDGRNYLATVERYIEVQDRWEIVCDMLQARCTFGISSGTQNSEQGFFVFGGFAHQPMNSCEYFNAESRRFVSVQCLHSKRFMLAALPLDWDLTL